MKKNEKKVGVVRKLQILKKKNIFKKNVNYEDDSIPVSIQIVYIKI